MYYFIHFLLWLLHFLAGASVFSFLTAAAGRLPRGEGIARGRSHCDHCGGVLTPLELVPCFSYIALRGRCRRCGGSIPRRCLVMETLGGLGAVACTQRYDPVPGLVVFAALSILAIVALIDLDTQEIWDRFWAALLLCGIAAVFALPQVSLWARAMGALAVSVPMLVLALAIPGGFGGGDIKLMFAAGFLLGWENALCAAFLAVLLGGGYGIWLLAGKKAGRKDAFAFGPFLCTGIAVALLWGDAILGWYLGLL